ncbi:ABC transporter substrate-binding protein [Frankia sp. Cpl3]|uniref:ABC transporter substrate-binding protein n=1 Tax=Parafrankia colletiae TaxID=573497 RepID=UPI000A8069F5|nr:ABC transporter substrate-binding protein [Parafrankia colletiae]MCK9905031.1 ABC transporter substrate-binding protein [Frankia sp. Cpl3]
MRTRRSGLMRPVAAIAAVAALVTAASCSTKGDDEDTPPAENSTGVVRTGAGIEGDVITLGVLTDFTGVNAASGKDVTEGQRIYWDQLNKGEKICGRFTVELDIKDHGYNVQTAVTQYAESSGDVLGFVQVLGSPMATALIPELEKDGLIGIPVAWAKNLAASPGYAVPGPTYDVETINGLDYLLSEGLIKEGDKIGHIFHDSEYGNNALEGSKFFAAQHGLTIAEQRIGAAEPDMTSRVTALAAEGVKAIVLTTQPSQTAGVAAAANGAGLDVPLLGNAPTFFPTLLDTPARDNLIKNFYLVGPNVGVGLPPAADLLKAYKDKFPNVEPSNSVVTGYSSSKIMELILQKACEDGDLTPEGVLAAKAAISPAETDGLTGTLDFSKTGISPSRESFLARPKPGVPGSTEGVEGNYEGPTVAAYVRS